MRGVATSLHDIPVASYRTLSPKSKTLDSSVHFLVHYPYITSIYYSSHSLRAHWMGTSFSIRTMPAPRSMLESRYGARKSLASLRDPQPKRLRPAFLAVPRVGNVGIIVLILND